MKDKTLEQLTDEEFGTVIESFIELEAEGTDKMEASTFLRLWSEIEKKRAKPTIEVEGNIVDGKLVLSLSQHSLFEKGGQGDFGEGLACYATTKI